MFAAQAAAVLTFTALSMPGMIMTLAALGGLMFCNAPGLATYVA
ncbi:hypothetical protein [Labrys monachus]|uniref:Uncharacterized protein n=1 Tax=Labrys monachus TaxID=217067 RepID=A0ABU0FHB6_9HYPH|nr:hypothetical protein [Labrys monachus]MDQ0393509.1 hypothetical protein [Labrys monachus]